MGNKQSSSSSVKNISNQLYVNKSTVNQLNKQLNNVIANTIVKSAINSGGTIINKQELIFERIKSKGDIDISDITQKQVAAITFSAMNKTDARNDAALAFITQTIDELKNNVSLEALAKMDGAASAKMKTGFLSGMPLSTTKSSSEVTNISNIRSVTESVKNIANVLQNRVENNFTTETVTNCIAKIDNSQIFKIQDVETTEGIVRIHNVTQEQAATAIAQCESIVGATNKIVNEAMEVMDLKVDETNSIKTDLDQTGETASELESSGIFESFFGSLSKIFSLDSLLSIMIFGIIGFIIFIILIVVIIKLIK